MLLLCETIEWIDAIRRCSGKPKDYILLLLFFADSPSATPAKPSASIT